MTPVLEARTLSVSFGGVRALVDVDLRIEPGQLVGLIGPNGAGKTTFIDAISGFVGLPGGRSARRPRPGRNGAARAGAPRPRAHLAVDRAVRRPHRA